MSIDPNEVQLTAAQRQLIADLAERLGRSPQDVLADLIAPAEVRRRNGRAAPTESAHELGKRLGLYAALEDGPTDLSSNRRYMEGFGQRADRTGTHRHGPAGGLLQQARPAGGAQRAVAGALQA